MAPAPVLGSLSLQPWRWAGSSPAWNTLAKRGSPTAPDRISSRIFRWEAASRRWWFVPSTTPARLQASIISRASATERASGFSQSTCLPAAAASTACARCISFVVLMYTAPTRGSRTRAERLA